MLLEKQIEQMATAERVVIGLDDIETICAEPEGAMCVSFGVSMGAVEKRVESLGLDIGK